MFHSRSIVYKYAFVGLIILLMVGVFTGLSFWFTNRIKGDARRINFAGRERMLSFEISSLINRCVYETGENRKKLSKHIKNTWKYLKPYFMPCVMEAKSTT